MEDNTKSIAKKHADGQMSDGEFAAFEAIIGQARGGDWTGAEQEIVRLAKAQRAGGPLPPPNSDKPSKSEKSVPKR